MQLSTGQNRKAGTGSLKDLKSTTLNVIEPDCPGLVQNKETAAKQALRPYHRSEFVDVRSRAKKRSERMLSMNRSILRLYKRLFDFSRAGERVYFRPTE